MTKNISSAFMAKATADIKPTTLADKAMLVRLKISAWRPYARDKHVQDALDQVTKTSNRHRASTILFKNSTRMKAIGRALADCRAYVNHHSNPWLDEGVRLMPSANYWNFTNEFPPLEQAALAAVADMAAHWDQEVQADIADITQYGGTSNPDLYPSCGQEFADHFRIVKRVEPIADNDDWRIAVSDEDKRALTEQFQEIENMMVTNMIDRIMAPVKALATRLGEYNGEKGQRWKDSIVTNLRDVLEVLPSLNINDDKGVNDLIADVNAAMAPYLYAPESLKHSHAARVQAKKQLDDILSNLGLG